MKAVIILLAIVVAATAVKLRFKPKRPAIAASSPTWCKSLDCPSFKVLEKTQDYELREYDSSAWVSTNMLNIDYSVAQRKMFMKLFDYIQGANSKKEKIDMTVPVRTRIIPGQGPACEDNFTMSFFLSPKVKDPPKPTDSTVFISRLPQKFTVYVSQFGGYYWSINDWIKKALELGAVLDKKALKYEKSYFYTDGYDSPWTLFNRHNEVWFVKL